MGKVCARNNPLSWIVDKVPHILRMDVHVQSVRSRLVFLACGNSSRLGSRPRVSFRFLIQSICGACGAGRLRFVLRHWFQELRLGFFSCSRAPGSWIREMVIGYGVWFTGIRAAGGTTTDDVFLMLFPSPVHRLIWPESWGRAM